MKAVEHAKQRATERYHVKVNRKVYYELINKIQSNKSVTIKRVSNSRSVHLVDGFVLVYSNTRKKIITFLPMDCMEMRQYKQEEK